MRPRFENRVKPGFLKPRVPAALSKEFAVKDREQLVLRQLVPWQTAQQAERSTSLPDTMPLGAGLVGSFSGVLIVMYSRAIRKVAMLSSKLHPPP